MKKQKQVVDGKIHKLWDYLAALHKSNPEIFESGDAIKQQVATRWKQLKDKEHCPNCGANMCIKEYTAGIMQVMLLVRLGEIVMDRSLRERTFGDANKVHIDSTNIDTPLKKQQSITSYFGLIEQPAEYRKSGYWRITDLGFDVLAGGSFPKKVHVHDKKTIAASGTTTTRQDVMRDHMSEVRKQVAMRKAVARDFRADVRSFDQPKWVAFIGTVRGKML